MASKPIQLYTAGTPNGQKISIALEELGIAYDVHKVDISKNVQKEEWFLKINPNGRIPAIIDPNFASGTHADGHRVFEGGAILQYLTGRYDSSNKFSFAHDSAEYWETIEWTTWMQSGLGPMQGQANHFHRYAPEKIPYAIDRYQGETKRLYQVLEDRFAEQEGKGKGLWLVGGKYSFADLACFSWIMWSSWAGVELDKFPNIQKWKKAIEERPATQKGIDVPEKSRLREIQGDKKAEEEYAKKASAWVIQGQKADQDKHK